MSSLKRKIKNSKFFVFLIMSFRRLFRFNVIKGKKHNNVKIYGLYKGAELNIRGRNNTIRIINPKANNNLKIMINGNNNKIFVDENCVLRDLNVWIEDDGNSVLIEKDTLICGKTKLSLIEGTSIVIGENSMFSDEIDLRTGDSHSIVNENGDRINPSKNIKIGKHCWVGHGATILKGVILPNNSIVATKAVVTKPFDNEGVILAGNPAKIVKENIDWKFERI